MPKTASNKKVEFRARADRIRARVRDRGLDAIFCMQPTNVWYVSGFWEFVPIRIEAVLVPVNGECVFIVSKNEYEYAVKTSWIEDIRYYTEFPEPSRHQNPYDLVVEAIHDRGLEGGRIGIEEDFISLADYAELRKRVPKVTFDNASDILKRCRMVKSAYEIDLLKKAGRVATSAWHASLKA